MQKILGFWSWRPAIAPGGGAFEGAPRARPGKSIASPWSRGLLALLALEVLLITAFRIPQRRFFRFAFFDSGGEFVRLHLWNMGDRPSVDFGYQYGLTLMLIQDVWYRLFGMTPGAFHGLVLMANLLTVWGLWRFARACRLGLAGLLLIVAAVPELLGTASISTAHNLEPALLVHALAEQAMGRPSRALALATACVFIKPTMAYVYGALILVGLIHANQASPLLMARACRPAMIVAWSLALVNLWVFGVDPTLNTLFPMEAAEVYRISGYGFFHGSGRRFWALPGARLVDYFRYEVGYWLLGSLLLSAGGLAAAFRLAGFRERGNQAVELPARRRNDGLILACAVMHVLFVTVFFGNQGSWVYYLVILILGLAAMTNRGRIHAAVGLGLAILVLVSDYSKARQTAREWTTLVRSEEMPGLWMRPEVREEWETVRRITRRENPVLVAEYEGGAVIFEGFTKPVCYFDPGRTLPYNIQRKRRQLSEARWIIVTLSYDWLGKRLWRPAIADTLEGCNIIWEGSNFAVYRRVRPHRASQPSTTTQPSTNEDDVCPRWKPMFPGSRLHPAAIENGRLPGTNAPFPLAIRFRRFPT